MAQGAAYGVYEAPLSPPQPSLVAPAPAYTGPVGYVHHGCAPSGISHELWSWFQAVDSDRNGCISADELQRALINSNWSCFNAETCRMMVGLFDLDNNGTIDIHEFGSLWKFLHEWKACFESFDQDRSGNIGANELLNAFQTSGYQLHCRSINLDDFIQCFVMVKTLTDRFRERGATVGGVLRIQYEEFLRMVLDNNVI